MLKADVTKEYTKLEIVGNIEDICVDLTHILSAINEKISEKDAAVGHDFRVMFTTGFMDGIFFDDDREHMEHYLEEGRKAKEKNERAKKGLEELLDGFIGFLKDRRNELEEARKKLDKLSEDSDEAK